MKVNPFDGPGDCFDDFERELERYDPAWAKAALYFRSRGECHFGHGAREIRGQSLLAIRERLEVFRRRLADGDTMAILQAVKECADENLPLPEWLAIAYRDALKSFLQIGGTASLDDVFTSPVIATATPQKAKLSRRGWQTGGQILLDVWALVNADDSIQSLDAALRAALEAKDYGVGPTKARELVLMVDESQRQFHGRESISQFLAKRRKR